MRVIWTERAASGLRAARAYLARESPRAAAEQASRIVEAGNSLHQFAERGRLGRVATTRELVVGATPYIVVYRVEPDAVQILAVLHAARRWPERF